MTNARPKPQIFGPRVWKAAEFIMTKLHPKGPWLLTAINPDGGKPTVTRTCTDADEVENFIGHNNNPDRKWGVYYSVNPARHALDSKAAKSDIKQADYLHVDIDPHDDETPEECWQRIEPEIEKYPRQPTFVIISGNGVHLLWRLREPVPLNSDADIAGIEARNYALAEAFGAAPKTRDVCRILRIPFTVNWPNLTKRKLGREPVMSELISYNKDISYDVNDFPAAEGVEYKASDDAEQPDRLDDVIKNGRYEKFGNDRSDAVWYVVNEMLRRGYGDEPIIKTLTDRNNKISEHVREQSEGAQPYAQRQLQQAIAKLDFERNEKGHPYPSHSNIHIALRKLGVGVRYDQFAHRTLLDGLTGFGPGLEDAAVDRLWLTIPRLFGFKPKKDFMGTVLGDSARLNGFHPVLDYLAEVEGAWDGQQRLDRWLIDYAGAEDSKYVRAVGRLPLIAAVRRMRQPGCKFDEMLVLEQPEQGNNRSSALAIMAVRQEWFSDDLPLNATTQKVIEQLRGRWLIECAELSGLKRSDVEHVKAMLSRQIDRSRMAYGHFEFELWRQCIFLGTTNKHEAYLFDTTGNRRWWPLLVQRFDLEALRRDRDQLWAEAAVREKAGESIRLPEELWPVAAREQKARVAEDPYVAILREHLGDREGRIKATTVYEILDVRGAPLNQNIWQRAADAMREIGWERPNKAGTLRFGGGVRLPCFVRGDSEEDRAEEIHAKRKKGELFVGTFDEIEGLLDRG